MARYAEAAWHRCPGSEPSIRPTQFIFHTAVMRDLVGLRNYFCSGRSGGIESHFGVGGKWAADPAQDGAVEQWRDTEEQADANLKANRRADGTGAISCETCDNAPQSPSDIEPWTPKQVAALIRLGRWAHTTHGIPLRICRTPDDPGYGWHAMWGAPSAWTPAVGKVCPGPRRVAQLKADILPAIFTGQEEDPDMAFTDAQAKLLADTAKTVEQIRSVLFDGHQRQNVPIDNLYRHANEVYDAMVVQGTTSATEAFELLFARVRNIESAVEAIALELGSTESPAEGG